MNPFRKTESTGHRDHLQRNDSRRPHRGLTPPSEGAAQPEEYFEKGRHIEEAVTVNRPRSDLYRFWHDFANLARFMKNLKAVEVVDPQRSRWHAVGPGGKELTWEAEIINDEPDALIAWRTVGRADLDNAGSVRFIDAPGNRGTEVKVTIEYLPPAGTFGSALSKLFGEDPGAQVREDLFRFKQLMEAGEIATTEGQPRGTCKG